MLENFTRLKEKNTHRVVGLMSGTSADGVDAALCEISGEGRGGLKVKLLAKHAQEYPDFLRERILQACEPKGGNSAELCELNFLIGEAFAFTTNALLDNAGIAKEEIDLIGSHGQTVSHIPPRTGATTFQLGSTLQLGEPAVIAERTGIPVISNFRTRDMAAGGQGAPLVPIVDYLLLSSDSSNRVVLNIGGISNITYLPAHGRFEETIAFDTGPGNMIVDAMVHYLTQGEQTFDRDGQMAASGTINQKLLNAMMQHDYLMRPPPKSTGREDFGVDFAVNMYEWGTRHGFVIMPRDIVATATLFTALTIADGLKRFVLSRGTIDEVIVSGGGALNPVLMAHLEKELQGMKIVNSDVYDVPIKAKESIAFAVLARETALGRPGNMPSATGASGTRILGQITLT
ncbi:MAG TPA: anhydro-N-acetylmuramic acid kinase [Planctomycetota bacterium]|nr:anhydro-N-acetylmuramic acid kinase [Planctomycetota bacterium]